MADQPAHFPTIPVLPAAGSGLFSHSEAGRVGIVGKYAGQLAWRTRVEKHWFRLLCLFCGKKITTATLKYCVLYLVCFPNWLGNTRGLGLKNRLK